MFKFLELIAMCNRLFYNVDKNFIRAFFDINPISSKSLQKYILPLTPLVEDAIIKVFSYNFYLMFNGWSDSEIHCVAVFATDVLNEEYLETMLACAPLLKKDDLRALKLRLFLVKTLYVYEKNLLNVVCLDGDSCAANIRLLNVLDIPIIDCHSHKLNLAVRYWIEGQP